VYTSPRPTEDELSRYYDANAEGGWQKGRDFDDVARADNFAKSLALKRDLARRLLDGVASCVAMPEHAERHAFDFGCAAGTFLDVLQDRGWKTTGMEPAHLREFARRRHTIIDGIPDVEQFHLVNVSHVLEHLLHPGQTLQALARASYPGAVLLCSVPDLEALPRTRDLHYVTNPVHINSFTSASLAGMMQCTGWRPVRVASGGFLPDATAKEMTRVMAVGVRDHRAPALPPPVEPLSIAEEALRAYGRLLGPDGKLRRSEGDVQ
jgi:SAM-dependent methyltransferase